MKGHQTIKERGIIKKNGNKYLAWAFLEAMHMFKRFCPQAAVFYKRKTIKVNKIVAIKAIARGCNMIF